ncbi:putative ribonuclease H-like domain-containing protein, partial [Tanacetum coccineum]
RWSKEVRRYHFEALNGIHHWEKNRIDFFKARMRAITEGNVFLDLRIKSVVRIDVKKKHDYGFLTSIVQDKLHRLPLELAKDFNNALLMFIRGTVIKNMVEDIQLGVESYQRTLNLTKPTMFFEGIDQRIPFTMTATHKGSESESIEHMKQVAKLAVFHSPWFEQRFEQHLLRYTLVHHALLLLNYFPVMSQSSRSAHGGLLPRADGDEQSRLAALCLAMELGADHIDVELKVSALGQPTIRDSDDHGRDSDDDDYQDRDYDVAALANNLTQAFRSSIYENDDNDEV